MKSSTHENINNKNIQDVFLRNATLSVLDLLNREIIIDLNRGDNITKHEIPFFYNFAGDEGFMKDFFTELPTDCKYPNFVEGNYEPFPKGIVTFTSFAIRTGDLTNNFVRGSFTQEERDINDNKSLQTFSSRLHTLPLTLGYSIKIESDNINKTFKILEKIFDFYHKTQVRYFQFRGIRIPGQIVFPDNAEMQKNYNFSYTDNTKVTISMNINMETYYPSFDDHSTMNKGNTIKQWDVRQGNNGESSNTNESFIDTDYPPKE